MSALTTNDVARRVHIHHQIDYAVDSYRDVPDEDLVRRLQLWASLGESLTSTRDLLIDVAAFAQSIVERIDREAA